MSADTNDATINYVTLPEEELKEIIKKAVSESMIANHCFLNEEERSIVRDVVTGGKYVKRSILAALAGAILYIVVKGVAAIKGVVAIKNLTP